MAKREQRHATPSARGGSLDLEQHALKVRMMVDQMQAAVEEMNSAAAAVTDGLNDLESRLAERLTELESRLAAVESVLADLEEPA